MHLRFAWLQTTCPHRASVSSSRTGRFRNVVSCTAQRKTDLSSAVVTAFAAVVTKPIKPSALFEALVSSISGSPGRHTTRTTVQPFAKVEAGFVYVSEQGLISDHCLNSQRCRTCNRVRHVRMAMHERARAVRDRIMDRFADDDGADRLIAAPESFRDCD